MSLRASHQWALAASLVAAWGFGNAAAAQELRGNVRDSTTQQPIPGAVVLVLDSAGRSLARGISNDRGQFRVATATAARQLRVMRIGFRPREVAISPGRSPSMDIAMVPLASFLEPVQVTDVTKCSRRSDRAAALALWEQVRTGLLATVVARETNPANMRRLLFDRVLDKSGNVQSQSVRIDSARTDRAFGAALSVADFLQKGFKSDSGGMDVLYGPDADILLSDGFAAGYCFRIADRDMARPGQIGLAFGPNERTRDRTDIEGTLWVDSIGRRIIDIDYAYLGLEPRVTALHPGGRTSFRTMANGMVVLDRWSIRLVGASSDSTTTITRRTVERTPVLYVREVGGEIAYAEWPDGVRWSASLGTLRGQATRDGAPARDTTVRLFETDYTAHTDSTGAFEIRELLPGPYDVGIENEQLARVGLLLPTGTRFMAARDSAHVAIVPIPSIEDYTWVTCKNDPKRPRAGRPIARLVIVRVVDADGRPMIGAKTVVKMIRGGDVVSSSDIETGAHGIVHVCGGAVELATGVTVFIDRDGMPPFKSGDRITGVLTTTSITLPAARPPGGRPQ